MRPLTIAAASLNQTPLDWEGNLKRIQAAIQKAETEDAHILCLPELAISAYGCEDLFHAEFHAVRAWQSLSTLALTVGPLLVCVGLPLRHQGKLFNVAAFLAGGEIIGLIPKKYLANDGIHYESRWFAPWPTGACGLTDEGIPIGDYVVRWGDVRIGCEICEDAWVAERPGRDFPARGVDVILNPSASHFSFGKSTIRKRYLLDGARAFGAVSVYSNLLGCESGRTIFDGDALIATSGAVVAETERFTLEEVTCISATVDLEPGRRQRLKTFGIRTLEIDSPEVVVSLPTPTTAIPVTSTATLRPSREDSSMRKEEEFTRAVTLGLFDYLRKSKLDGYVVSLSGGADSTAVTLLVYLMVKRVWEELSPEVRGQSFAYAASLKDAAVKSEAALFQKLFACAYQRTENNSETTFESASAVAMALKAPFFTLDVDGLRKDYLALIEGALGTSLDWQQDDLALQNLQSRIRSPGIWLLANVRRAILLTTGNRSESSVGYATMDGDSSGGFNPIGGIDKPFLQQWLTWIAEKGFQDAPIPAVAKVTALQPSAELRPIQEKQTDEADLMPYSLLGIIERCAVFDGKSPLETFQYVRETCSEYADDILRGYITRFYKLWAQNQWKRERYAPSFHVDDYNVDPRSWCRFPILSSGYEDELRKLQEWQPDVSR